MSCSICGHAQYWYIPFARDELTNQLLIERNIATDYQWYLCQKCGNGFQSAESDREVLHKIWQANRLLDSYKPEEREQIVNTRITGARKSALRAYRFYESVLGVRNGSMLDVGCGLGELVKVYQDHQWDAFGVDPDSSTKEFHEKLGINTIINQIEDVKLERVYDAVFTTHSIYFVSEPVEFLNSLKQFIAPNGYLCVAVANFFANNDAGLPGYMHTFFPSGQSMVYLLALAGYRTVFIKYARGSVYIAAKADESISPDKINTRYIYWLYRSKRIRYLLLGVPGNIIRRLGSLILNSILKLIR